MKDAMSGLATGAKGNDREQTVHTPDVILDVCMETFGGYIQLDPCASPTHTFARVNTYEAGDGLSHLWVDGTYWNCPFKHLKAWMAHAYKQPVEHIGLFPVRSNRTWWCHHMSATYLDIAWLKPVLFKGYEKGTVNPRGEIRKADERFPSPLVLVYHGNRSNRFRDAVESAGIACHISGAL